MGSIPIGGRYRLIDFILSNMVNSGISDIGVVTKSNYQSLMDHLGSGREWDLARKKGGLCILPPFGHAGSGIYRGKLEALHGILGYIRHSQAKYFVLADCDVIANIDLKKAVDQHVDTGADVTILYKKGLNMPETVQESTVFEIDETGRVTDVFINPQTSGECNINLNMYIISKDLLEKVITETSSRNLYSFRKDFLQASVGKLWFQGYEVKEEARKINCMKSYYEANMAMFDEDLRNSLFLKDRPIYTKVRDEVPTTYGLQRQGVQFLGGRRLRYRWRGGEFDYFPWRPDWKGCQGEKLHCHAGYHHWREGKPGLCNYRQGRYSQRQPDAHGL